MKGLIFTAEKELTLFLQLEAEVRQTLQKQLHWGVPYAGDFWDFYETDRIVTEALPVGTVLTIAAAGSEGSSGSVITNEESLLKWSVGGDATVRNSLY